MREIERLYRIGDDAPGWRVGYLIYADHDLSIGLMAWWWMNSEEDQEDLGVPAMGWRTAYGYWLAA